MAKFVRLLLACVCVCLVSVVAAASGTNSRPNIIFILADDLGWSDLGCYGSTFYETPNIDRLASGGMRFTDAYAACCVCSPTRASILTGKYPPRLKITDWLPGQPDKPEHKLLRPNLQDHLSHSEFTVAAALKQAGYTTACIGKWHLGGPEYYPEKFGFDLNVAACKLGHPPSYFSPYKIPTLKDGPKGEYLTDRLTDEALKFIREFKDKPFFLYLAHYAVHLPKQAKAELIEKYKRKAAASLEMAGPEFGKEGNNRVRLVQRDPVYAAMIQSLDESVGRIMKQLEDLRLLTNTIVIFTSDNGGLSITGGCPTSNEPLRGGKGWAYEGGVREPLIVQWQGTVRPGSQSASVVISPDFYPTFLEAVGQPLRPQQHLDGMSFLSALHGAPPRVHSVFWHYPHYSNQAGPPYGAIRRGNLKLIEWYEDMRAELFDLSKDVGEKHDLAESEKSTVDSMRAELHQWRKSVRAEMPKSNPDYKDQSRPK